MATFNLNDVPRIRLCSLPTPITPLKRLSEYLGGANIYIKRDDLTGVAFGGNKNRKLEFLLADAKKKQADVIITEGALQSNHCLQTAASALKTGFECELVLSGEKPETITGNLLLDQILDVKIHRVNENSDRKMIMQQLETELKKQGKIPYVIPTGGSTKVGALGYINFISEIMKQSNKMDIIFSHLIHATGSGGTQAGLFIGNRLYSPKMIIVGVGVGDPKEELEKEILDIIIQFKKEWDLALDFNNSEIEVLEGYSGEGYGIASDEMIRAVKLVAKLEGIFLDPVYNGKAMVGLIDLIKSKIIPDESNVLFLHSGGGPALFRYSSEFGEPIE
ncbi:MAG: D-cysteine desulfhydrase family protein [Candidatus Hodarchaeales archaeon]|jgi:D-cysteine desulfhydrase family pyridoxal phosphate-dependent enzyme